MPPQSDLQAIVMAVGRLEGRVGELIHGQNSQGQKLDAIAEKVAVASNIPARVDDLDQRVTALETDRDKREGAMGLGGWLLRSPLFGWLATAAVTAWALFKGKAGQ